MPGIENLFASAAPQAQSVENPINISQNIATNDKLNQLRQAQTSGAMNDLQQKQRAMQISMLNGVLNEQDPDKQRQILQNIVPIANKINPSYQIDPNIDVPTVRALVASQVSPEKQAELGNQLKIAQIYGGAKVNEITKDPATGQLVRVNKATGEVSPLSPADSASYNATGQILGGESAQPSQSSFGFGASGYAANPNALKLAQKTTADYDKNRAQRESLINDLDNKVTLLEPDLKSVQGGSDVNKLGLRLGNIYGSDEAKAANDASSQSQGLALDYSQLQQAMGGTGGRAMKAALQTLLASKPDATNNYQETNLKSLTSIKNMVNTAKLQDEFLDSYKEANPNKVIDNNAYQLFDALAEKYPLISKDGKTFNNGNVGAFKDAIGDAIQNPYNYIKKPNAASQAQGSLKQSAPVDNSGGTQIVKTQAEFDALPSGAVYAEPDGKKYRKP